MADDVNMEMKEAEEKVKAAEAAAEAATEAAAETEAPAEETPAEA